MWRKKVQVLAALSATVSEISDGMQYGWSAPITAILQSPGSPIPIKGSEIIGIETALLIGTLVGLPITILLMENFGRRQSILMAAVQNLIAWIIISQTSTVYLLYLARFLSGISASVVFAVAPVYVAEIADKDIRGFLSSFFGLMMIGGILLVYCVVPFVSILTSSMVGASFLLVQLTTFPFLPESPYYLVVKGSIDKARVALQRLRGVEDVEIELEDIINAIAKEKLEKGRFIDLFMVKSNFKAFLIMVVLNIAQHFAGIGVMLMNIHVILQNASSSISPNLVAILFGIVMWLAALIGSQFVDRVGRKPIMLISSTATGVVLILLAVYLTVLNGTTDISSYKWIPTVLVLIYAGTFRSGLGLVPVILTAEVFPSSVKSIGVSLSEASYTGSSFIAVSLFPHLVKVFGLKGPFYIFGISCFLTSLFIIFFVPETKCKSLHEIQHLIKGVDDETAPLIKCDEVRSIPH